MPTLRGAELSQIKNIRGVYGWKGAQYDAVTKWPADFDPVEAGALLVKEKGKGET